MHFIEFKLKTPNNLNGNQHNDYTNKTTNGIQKQL
jgi:hypothetical protein